MTRCHLCFITVPNLLQLKIIFYRSGTLTLCDVSPHR